MSALQHCITAWLVVVVSSPLQLYKAALMVEKRYHLDQTSTMSLHYHASICQLKHHLLQQLTKELCIISITKLLLSRAISITKSSFYLKCEYATIFKLSNFKLSIF